VNTLWTCPRCSRQFKNKNQWHSCVTISVDDHFKGKHKRLRAIFDRLYRELMQFGSVRVDAVKTGINLARDSHFAMVFIKNDWINLDFDLKRELISPRFEKSFRVYNDNYS
jgi:hypothetical protein